MWALQRRWAACGWSLAAALAVKLHLEVLCAASGRASVAISRLFFEARENEIERFVQLMAPSSHPLPTSGSVEFQFTEGWEWLQGRQREPEVGRA